MTLTRRSFLVAGGTVAAGAAMPGGAEGDVAATASASWQAAPVRVTGRGRLVYRRDGDGNRLPDFGHAGYHCGERPLPDVSPARTVGPVDGDNTGHLQAALEAVGRLPLGPDGFRGALQLEPGEYPVAGTLRLNRDGVVLRGAGSGSDPATNTVVRGTGTSHLHPPVILAGGADTWGPGTTLWAGQVPGTRTDITTDVVGVGQRTFRVAEPGVLTSGDNVVIVHPCTAAWLAAVDGGGTHGGPPWRVGAEPILYNRYVEAVDGERVTVDVPLFATLRRELSPSYVYRWDRARLVREVGVEDLHIDISYAGQPDQDEDHAGAGVALSLVEDAWVRNCTVRHFWFSGVRTTETTRATIENCRAFDPVSRLAGSRRYNFAAGPYSQQILFADCHATEGRHNFVAFGRSKTSGIVFLRCKGEGSHNASEGHAGWSQGLLYDNHRDVDPHEAMVTLLLGCRGNYGTNQGWAAVNSVAWNCTAGAPGRIVVQQPPTAQNYAIGCTGDVSGIGPFTEPAGWIEGSNRPGLLPASLYEAQLVDRLARTC
ncbi:peptidoglycan-binding protein [Jiangella asiatica]|uniref:Peptidoglycan-binding protein n=1 Tax=Jiangella asiatica TaxID=2530372 RepID=A0A4R5DAQ0_9ACTN|nr:peptidoglycan-binding protein [Jiangella asiatica]TDE10679.1 peptidoglycan-binding protein [Jiangella asiatica]